MLPAESPGGSFKFRATAVGCNSNAGFRAGPWSTVFFTVVEWLFGARVLHVQLGDGTVVKINTERQRRVTVSVF